MNSSSRSPMTFAVWRRRNSRHRVPWSARTSAQRISTSRRRSPSQWPPSVLALEIVIRMLSRSNRRGAHWHHQAWRCTGWRGSSSCCARQQTSVRPKSLVSRSSATIKKYRGLFERGARAPTYGRDVGAHCGFSDDAADGGARVPGEAGPKALVKVLGPLFEHLLA
jgi:hypothetical protein